MVHERFRTTAIVVIALASAAVLPRLPAAPPGWPLPGWGQRLLLAFFLPVTANVLCLLFTRLLRFDARQRDVRRLRPAYETVLDVGVAFILGLHLVLLATLLGAGVWISTLPPLFVGAALVVVGNVLPRLRPNPALGVHTPWTVRSERVWARTHRVSGYLLVVWGLAVMTSAGLAPGLLPGLVLYGAAGLGVGVAALSYWIWRSSLGPPAAADPARDVGKLSKTS
jgi:hypothetical protein